MSTTASPAAAAPPGDAASLVGRGNKEGNRLFREWYAELTTAPERDEKAAYVFVMGSMAELLRVFDFHTIFPEVNGLRTAVRHVADEYIAQAEDYGYQTDVCGYVKADVGLQFRGGQHPMGTIPPPALSVYTNACNTYIKWAEIWERIYGVPIFTLDIPGSRRAGGQTWSGSVDFANDLRYVRGQIDELIGVCEQVSGKRFDIDKLREIMGYANRMSVAWKKVIELNKARPAVYNAVTDGTVYLGVVNGFRGRPEGARYFERLVAELAYKAANGIGTNSDEAHRPALPGGGGPAGRPGRHCPHAPVVAGRVDAGAAVGKGPQAQRAVGAGTGGTALPAARRPAPAELPRPRTVLRGCWRTAWCAAGPRAGRSAAARRTRHPPAYERRHRASWRP